MKKLACKALIFGMLTVVTTAWAGAAEKAPGTPSTQPATAQDEAAREATQRANCQNNLKQLGIVMKMFAGENKNNFPALDPRAGYLMFVADKIFPEYITDTKIMICPADKGQEDLLKMAVNRDTAKKFFDQSSYWYLGYATTTEEEGLALAEEYKTLMKAGKELPQEIAPSKPNGMPVHVLKEGVERFFITDINNPAGGAMTQSRIPVIFERPGFHKDGANVLYMDGHVEFVKYPGKYPMTERFVNALKELDKLRAPAK
jgi:prepilin-type processing-associated H-X9-DG protein